MARKATELRPIMTRMPEHLRAKIERAAERNDASMNAEIVDRLAQSFDREREFATYFGDGQIFGLVRLVAAAMTHAGQSAMNFKSAGDSPPRDSWLQDAYAYKQASVAVQRVLEQFAPEGSADAPGATAATLEIGSNIGREAADHIVRVGSAPKALRGRTRK